MTPKTELLPHDGGFILSEGPGSYSRERVTVLLGQNLRAGAVLGQVSPTTPATAVAFPGNAGTGVMGTITVGASALVGVHRLVMTGAGATAAFTVFDPLGRVIGAGAVASAFVGGGLSFTLADGTPDFAVGDGFHITVAGGKYRALVITATATGSVARGVLFGATDATDADLEGVAIVRGPAELRADDLVWPAGTTDAQKAQAAAELALVGIIVRTGPTTVQVGPGG